VKELTKWRIYETLSMIFCIAGIYGCIVASIHFFTQVYTGDILAFAVHSGLGCFFVLWGTGFIIAAIYVAMLTVEVNRELIGRVNEEEYMR
jgi:hypothetical protein